MKILLLGGTSDARLFAKRAYHEGLFSADDGKNELVYSVAGLVRQPDVPCAVISGGFTQFGGLGHYIKNNNIDAVLDMTHPYANTMSDTAVRVCGELGKPCWRFIRSQWAPKTGDDWINASDWSQIVDHCCKYNRVLLTIGQLEQGELDGLKAALKPSINSHLIIRTAAPPRINLPDDIYWIKAIGPFDVESEKTLLVDQKVDLLVSKNSGGVATSAKLVAARELGIPVVMLERPKVNDADKSFSTIEECITYVGRVVSTHCEDTKPGNKHAF